MNEQIKRGYRIKLAVILVCILSIIAASCSKDMLKTPIERGAEYSYYKDFLSQFIHDDILTIDKNDDGAKFLMENIKLLNDLMDISKTNIRNANTYDTLTNMPEKALDASIDKYGVLTIKPRDSERFEFDPSNPLADKSGYITLSDISIEAERRKVEYYTAIRQCFYKALNEIDSSFIFTENR